MHLRWLMVGLGLWCGASCARPSLDQLDLGEPGAVDEPDADVSDDDDDAGATLVRTDAGARESEVVDAGQGDPPKDSESSAAPEPPRDAGQAKPESSCSDGDRDGVCDEVDNCPKVANAEQADADQDGRGDACPKVEVNCGEPIQSGVSIGAATVDSVRINDTPATLARVAPGSSVTLRVFVKFSTCAEGSSFRPQLLYVGLESSGASCQPSFCSGSFEAPLPYTFTIEAPDTPGLHQVLAGVGQALQCGSSGGMADTPIAALCVLPSDP